MTNWTPQQKQALEAENCTLLVSAAAGSGKTAVLTERIAKRIIDPNCPLSADNMAVVTFTKAAAKEMKDRISKKLSEECAKNPKNTRLKNQLMLIGGARISTIHSFCYGIIRENADKAGVSSTVRIADDEQKKKLPMRKLTLDELKEFYRERFEVECGNYSDQRKDALSTQSFFINNFRKNFSNWQSAVSKFVATARTITAEPIGTTNAVALLLNAMGFVRAVPEEAEFNRLMEDYRSVIEKKAEKGKLGVQAEAANFMLGSSGSQSQNDNAVNRGYAAADIRDVFFHWDVFGNIVDHLCNGKIKILHNIRVRDFAENPEEGRKLGNYLETVGSYQVYHYTVEVSGSMESIRAFCQSLDQSWKQRRFYVVRAVTLYAEENGAAILMKQEAVAKSENNAGNSEEEASRGRRRRRRTTQNNSGDANNQQNEEDLRRQEAERIKRMKVHERPGYGAVLIGIGDMYRAFVDFDYVVLDKNQ